MIKKVLLFIFGFMVLMIPNVNAEEIIVNSSDISFYIQNKDNFEEQNNILLDYYNNNLSNDYSYYFTISSTSYPGLIMYATNSIQLSTSLGTDNNRDFHSTLLYLDDSLCLHLQDNEVNILNNSLTHVHDFYSYYLDDFSTLSGFSFFYDSNSNIIYNQDLFFFNTMQITNFYSNSNIIIKENETIPLLKNLLKYNSFEDYILSPKYTEVFLDDYEYVILSLKDYSKTKAFETNLQVKGMIGITPVYEYGTVEKETITDRCNISYSDYTNYRFFILENDLINNAVYYVKSCESSSSFKYDSTIFNIHYVTAETVNDPVITVGGNSYNIIPFNKLSNSANNNESNNFVPGAIEQFNPFESVVDYISSFWNSLTTFMGLVTKFFNTLPIEIRAISITCFTTACTLGLLKILKA